jgi:hypothetical protein
MGNSGELRSGLNLRGVKGVGGNKRIHGSGEAISELNKIKIKK